MSKRRTAITTAWASVALTALGMLSAGQASATTPSRLTSHIDVRFDLAKGQLPENIVLEPDGTADITLAAARQVVSVTPAGAVQVLATMPLAPDGGKNTPALHFALTTGIARATDGTLYFLYASGDADTTGLWRLHPGGKPKRIAALPANGLPNGLALDRRNGMFYVTDSVLGKIFSVPAGGGRAVVWSSAAALAPAGFLGANGLKVRGRALWATNLDKGTLLRIPVRSGNRPGPVQIRARNLVGLDDFAFTGHGDNILAALNGPARSS